MHALTATGVTASRAHARRRRRRHRSAHPQAQTRQLLPRGPSRALLARGPRGDSGRVRDGGLRRVDEESGADSGADGHGPHEPKPSIKDLRGAGRDDSRPQERDSSDDALPCIRVDAAYVRCRDEGHASSCAQVTAIGAGADGYRRLLGLGAVDAESYAGRLAFLRSLRERGADGVVCAASDAHEGLGRAVGEVFPGAAWQRCVVRLMGNAAPLAPTRRERAAALAILHAGFAERDPGLVRGLYRLACREICGFRPKAAGLLEEAEADALACLDFPYARRRRPRASNVRERANRELKRRSRVVQVLPSGKSLIRMPGAVFSEMDEGRAAGRRFTEESIAQALAPARPTAPAPAYGGTAEEHARRIIDVVIADDPIGRKAA